MLLLLFHKITNSRLEEWQRTTQVIFYIESIALFCFQDNKSWNSPSQRYVEEKGRFKRHWVTDRIILRTYAKADTCSWNNLINFIKQWFLSNDFTSPCILLMSPLRRGVGRSLVWESLLYSVHSLHILSNHQVTKARFPHLPSITVTARPGLQCLQFWVRVTTNEMVPVISWPMLNIFGSMTPLPLHCIVVKTSASCRNLEVTAWVKGCMIAPLFL